MKLIFKPGSEEFVGNAINGKGPKVLPTGSVARLRF